MSHYEEVHDHLRYVMHAMHYKCTLVHEEMKCTLALYICDMNK